MALPVIYNNIKLAADYRIDLLVNNKIILELKSVNAVALNLQNTINDLFKTLFPEVRITSQL